MSREDWNHATFAFCTFAMIALYVATQALAWTACPWDWGLGVME